LFGLGNTEIGLPTESIDRDSKVRPGYVIWGALVLVFTIPILAVAYETAVHFSGVAIDGPFQLYNALRRIQGGFRPGVDFQYFHGLGIPYLHYGLFRMFGGGLVGSELARELVAAAATPVVFLVSFRAFTKAWAPTLCLCSAALAASFALKLSAILFASNGMLGVRAALPTLVPVVIYLNPNVRARTVATGLAIGVSLLLSTEQGLAIMFAFVIVSAVAIARQSNRRRQVVESSLTAAIAIATLLVCLLGIGGSSGLVGALRYNFEIVPMDQYWFFGAPPNPFIPSWRAGLRMVVQTPLIGAALCLGALGTMVYLTRFWRDPQDDPEGDRRRRNFALAMLAVYGLISCASLLGAFVPAYSQPCLRVLLILGGLELTAAAARYDTRLSRRWWLGVPRGSALATLLIAAWTTSRVSLIWTSLTVSVPHIAIDHVVRHQPFSYSGIWPVTLGEGQRLIEAHRDAHGELPTLWSTYAGWIEARNGIFHPSFDYVIHALGPKNREAYVATFRKMQPALVQTVDPTYTRYEAWIESNDWGFYDALLDWYVVAGRTPWSIFWERRDGQAPGAQPIGMMDVPPGASTVQLPVLPHAPGSAATLVEVDVEYETHNPLHWIPIIGPSPRYLIGIEGAVTRTPISLDPWVRQTRFPLLVAAGQRPTLHFETASLLPGVSWKARTLRLSVRPIDARNQVWLSTLVHQMIGTPN
jgi:hypothetical protein